LYVTVIGLCKYPRNVINFLIIHEFTTRTFFFNSHLHNSDALEISKILILLHANRIVCRPVYVIESEYSHDHSFRKITVYFFLSNLETRNLKKKNEPKSIGKRIKFNPIHKMPICLTVSRIAIIKKLRQKKKIENIILHVIIYDSWFSFPGNII
jgi:hypothetical protein